MDDLYISGFSLSSPIDPESYISRLPIIKLLTKMEQFDFSKQVTFLVGENGCGKSTLLEAIAICSRLNAEGGSRNFSFSTNATESDLCRYIKIIKRGYEKDSFFLRAESFYNVATKISEMNLNLNGYGGKSLHGQSHGESFLSLIGNRFRGNGLYILDEPEAALSPVSQMSLLIEIDRLVKSKSQLIIATHSPIVMSYPNADIYEITPDSISLTPYTDTSHYRVSKQFLCNTEHMLNLLLSK